MSNTASAIPATNIGAEIGAESQSSVSAAATCVAITASVAAVTPDVADAAAVVAPSYHGDILIGSSDFREMVSDDNLYIDKSLLIKEVIDSKDKIILITRPRRWGKSLNLSMLNYFFMEEIMGQKTADLFANLKIAHAKTSDGKSYIEKYQGKYPVIYLNFKDVLGNTYDEMVKDIGLAISKACSPYIDIIKKSEKISHDKKRLFYELSNNEASIVEIKNSIEFISHLFFEHFGVKSYILIDEYDSPLNNAYGRNYFDDFISFVKATFSLGLKDNIYLEKAVLTGVLQISKDSMLSGLNNISTYTLLDDVCYTKYFGFTEEEINWLLRATAAPTDTSQDIERRKNELEKWYNGYRTKDELTIFNPWSVMEYLDRREAGTYWVQTGSVDKFIKQALFAASTDTKEQFAKLLFNDITEEIEIDPKFRYEDIITNDCALWSLLLFTGYLSLHAIKYDSEYNAKYQLRVPNREVKTTYTTIFKRWLSEHTPSDYTYTSLCLDLVNGDFVMFSKKVNYFLAQVASIKDFTRESNYHTFMLGLLSALQETHLMFSNRESGRGFPDVLMLTNPICKYKVKDYGYSLGIILEFKYIKTDGFFFAEDDADINKVAAKALAQINTKVYSSALRQYPHITKIAKVAMVFKDRNMLLQYEMEDV